MAKKRGNNEGSIHRRPNGSWRAQVTLQGRRLSHTANTRRECQDWLKKTIGQIDDGMTVAGTKISLGEYLTGWLNSSKAYLKQTTWAHYNHLSRQYIIPSLGQVKLINLRTDHIQRLYDQLLAKDVGTYTVLKIHTVIHSALNQAIKTGILNRNPATVTVKPREPEKEMKILEESQVSQMLIAAKGHRWEALYHLALSTGMRQMELLGLKWTDVNWQKQTIKVERQLVSPTGKGVQFSSPKTKFGKRTLALGTKTIEILKAHDERQYYEEQVAGDNWVEHGLIFTNKYGGPIDPRNLLRNFKQLLRKAGLPEMPFHNLRHTSASASLALNHGTPIIVVSRRLGHARPSITLDVYGHLIASAQEEAAELIDSLITPIQLHPVAPGCTRITPDLPQDLDQ